MVTCPRCGFGAEDLHPLPPEVVTKDLLTALGVEEGLVEFETCDRCITELLERP